MHVAWLPKSEHSWPYNVQYHHLHPWTDGEVCLIWWSLVVLYRVGVNASIVMLREHQSSCARIRITFCLLIVWTDQQEYKQEYIPVGCVPPACWPHPSMHCAGWGCLHRGCLPRGCLPKGVSVQGGVCLGDVCPGRCLPRQVSAQGVVCPGGVYV